jgi:hypothetical protein
MCGGSLPGSAGDGVVSVLGRRLFRLVRGWARPYKASARPHRGKALSKAPTPSNRKHLLPSHKLTPSPTNVHDIRNAYNGFTKRLSSRMLPTLALTAFSHLPQRILQPPGGWQSNLLQQQRYISQRRSIRRLGSFPQQYSLLL